MIRCCKGCTARRLRCHVWGECVHYMHEQALQQRINDELKRKWAGKYFQSDSALVNRHTREAMRKK